MLLLLAGYAPVTTYTTGLPGPYSPMVQPIQPDPVKLVIGSTPTSLKVTQ